MDLLWVLVVPHRSQRSVISTHIWLVVLLLRLRRFLLFLGMREHAFNKNVLLLRTPVITWVLVKGKVGYKINLLLLGTKVILFLEFSWLLLFQLLAFGHLLELYQSGRSVRVPCAHSYFLYLGVVYHYWLRNQWLLDLIPLWFSITIQLFKLLCSILLGRSESGTSHLQIISMGISRSNKLERITGHTSIQIFVVVEYWLNRISWLRSYPCNFNGLPFGVDGDSKVNIFVHLNEIFFKLLISSNF